MNESVAETGTWLKPLGDVFLGLNTSAVIRRVIGNLDIAPDLPVVQLPGLSWSEFVAAYADESVRAGLNYAWVAMAKERVARTYWPRYLPFKSGVIVRMRPVTDDPIISFVIHLSPVMEYNLGGLIDDPMLKVMDIMVRIGHRIFSGMDGPLTDRQVKDVGQLVDHTDHIRQFLHDLRAEVLLPVIVAPLPYPIGDLAGCSKNDFSHRRITTHQLSIHCGLSRTAVYCQPVIKDSVRQIVDTLLTGIVAQSTITLTDTIVTDTQSVHLDIQYRTEEPALQVKERVDPVTVSDLNRLGGMRTIQRLVTTAQSRLRPVKGRAWAEPLPGTSNEARIVLVLPHWQGDIPTV